MARRAARRILTGLLAAAAVLAVAVAALAGAALQAAPAVQGEHALAPEDLGRALAVLRAHDPRRAAPGRRRVLALSADDATLLLDHAARRWLHRDGAGDVALARGSATVRLSLPLALPALPGRWLNVRVELAQAPRLPELRRVTVGRLPLPRPLALALARRALAQAGLEASWPRLAEAVQRVVFEPGRAVALYAWQGDDAAQVLHALLKPDEYARLHAHAQRVAVLAERADPLTGAPMAAWIGPLFEHARQRSSADGGDAALENRAAIVALALYATGHGLDALRPPGSPPWPRAQPVRLLLGGRDDWPRHWLVSAALAVESTGPLSQALGLYKELDDARRGSGFSFDDMAANRAGTRTGERAVRHARSLQDRLARGVDEAALMPRADDLPTFLPAAEFERRFGGVDSPRYRALIAEIERRVDALAVLQP